MRSRPHDEAGLLLGQLSDQAGPRPPTSPQEALAAAYLNAQLRRAGLGVSTYELRATPRRGGALLALALIGLAAAPLTLWLPLPGLALALYLLAALLYDTLAEPLPWPQERRSSQNIVGTRAIAGGGGLRPATPSWRVLLLAPLDSPAPPAPPALAAIRLGAGLLIVAAAGLQLALGGLWSLAQIPAAAALIGVALAEARPPRWPASPDGGAGALAALTLAAQQVGQLERVELWAIAIGASASDQAGVASLFARYPFSPESTLVICLGPIGGGPLRAHLRPGRRGLPPAIQAQVAAAIEQAEGIVAGPTPRVGLAARLGPAGPPALMLASAAGAGCQADPAAVEQAAELVLQIVGGLEKEGAHD